MPSPRPQKQYFDIKALNLVWECGVNTAVLLGSFFISFIIGMIALGNDSVVFIAAGVTLATTLWRAYLWYGKWLNREYEIQQIEITHIDQQNEDFVSPTKKAQAKEEILARKSGVWFSYIWFILPYASIAWLVISLLMSR